MKKKFVQIGEPIRQGKFIDWTDVQINEWKILKKIPYKKNSGMSAANYEDEWLNNPKSFEEWSLSHGYADNLTIDRIDSNKDYCPENCRWITLEENTRKASSIYIEVNGITKNQKQWDEYLNKPAHHIGDYKLKYGMERTKEYIASLLEERKERNEKNGKEQSPSKGKRKEE